MKTPQITFWTEADRLAEVARYQIANTPQEPAFDSLARQAAAAIDAPIALITVLTEDHQWFKATVGTQLTGTVRAISFCTHAIEQEDTMVVPDASNDERFVDNPLVTGKTNIRFYAGVPLRSPRGLPLGTLCVLDQKPATLRKTSASRLRRWPGRSSNSSKTANCSSALTDYRWPPPPRWE